MGRHQHPAVTEPRSSFFRYGCATAVATPPTPHGANCSQYKIFAAKLLFNNSPADDDAEYPELVTENGPGTYGGL